MKLPLIIVMCFSLRAVAQQRVPAQQTDQFTIDIDIKKDEGTIKFTWDQTEAFAPFRVVRR